MLNGFGCARPSPCGIRPPPSGGSPRPLHADRRQRSRPPRRPTARFRPIHGFDRGARYVPEHRDDLFRTLRGACHVVRGISPVAAFCCCTAAATAAVWVLISCMRSAIRPIA